MEENVWNVVVALVVVGVGDGHHLLQGKKEVFCQGEEEKEDWLLVQDWVPYRRRLPLRLRSFLPLQESPSAQEDGDNLHGVQND